MEQELQKRIEVLEKWMEEKKKQQISYPLDIQSITILGKYFLRIINNLVIYSGGASGRGFKTLFAKQNDTGFRIEEDTSQIYTVDPSTDIFTVQKFGYANDTQLFVFTTDTIPGGLAFSTTYYVVSASGLTFKLSASSGGAAINITTAGVGIQFLDYI